MNAVAIKKSQTREKAAADLQEMGTLRCCRDRTGGFSARSAATLQCPTSQISNAPGAGILVGLPRLVRYAEMFRECFID
jgi:hypothetical protein